MSGSNWDDSEGYFDVGIEILFNIDNKVESREINKVIGG